MTVRYSYISVWYYNQTLLILVCILVKNAFVVLLNNSFISVKYKHTLKTVILLSNMIDKCYNIHGNLYSYVQKNIL